MSELKKMFPDEYDPTEHLGEVVPSCDPETMKRSLTPNDGVVYFRLRMLDLMLHQPEYVEYQNRREVLLPLFATFPFRVAEVLPDGSFRLDGEGFGEEVQKCLAEIRNNCAVCGSLPCKCAASIQ